MNSSNLYLKREKDWRNGAIVYQVLVDRFAPSNDILQKLSLYQKPKKLMSWNELPKPGPFLEDVKYCAHELEYWGGDLKSLLENLDYIKNLNVDVLYLNPIHYSLSNHKYDASNYLQISPEYGSFEDLKKLSDKVHQDNMKIMLDGVFNHVGVSSPLFQEAKDPKSPKRQWFDFNPKYADGVRLWADVKSLPELNLENQEVRDYIYQADDSVIKTYLKLGMDGWRLDVAFDLGFEVLAELTAAAHEQKPGSMVVGEIWNYPKDWFKSIDGVMNFTFREIIFRVIKEQIEPARAMQMFTQVIHDSGIENILKSWTLLDNHDVPRLIDQLPNDKDQQLAQILQFTLPGSPNLYYGTELGMTGGIDPMNRAPMRWDLNTKNNPYLVWTQSLIHLHQNERALKIGDYVPLLTKQLIGYERKTDDVSDTVIILLNPSTKSVTEDVLIPDSKLMNYSDFITLKGNAKSVQLIAGILHLTIEPKSYVILKPKTSPSKSYTPYKRV
ncbi:MAG: glycoside hydrolase family 13 protein [Firmicutes bacterium]|nr:glycoside hydrolase family 13 protein [Bacillota bacterium]